MKAQYLYQKSIRVGTQFEGSAVQSKKNGDKAQRLRFNAFIMAYTHDRLWWALGQLVTDGPPNRHTTRRICATDAQIQNKMMGPHLSDK